MAGVVDLGDVKVSRLEESYGPGFPANVLMPSFDGGVRDEFGPDTIAQFVEPGTDAALLSIHTWVIRTPQKTILPLSIELPDQPHAASFFAVQGQRSATG